MRIVVITKRQERAARLRREEEERLGEVELRKFVRELTAKNRECVERRRRLMALIWQCHDEGLLPYELDSHLLNEWGDDREAI
jgi:hypothetical protein